MLNFLLRVEIKTRHERPDPRVPFEAGTWKIRTEAREVTLPSPGTTGRSPAKFSGSNERALGTIDQGIVAQGATGEHAVASQCVSANAHHSRDALLETLASLFAA